MWSGGELVVQSLRLYQNPEDWKHGVVLLADVVLLITSTYCWTPLFNNLLRCNGPVVYLRSHMLPLESTHQQAGGRPLPLNAPTHLAHSTEA